MGREKRMTVGVALTPDPQLLPVLRGLVGRLAEQAGLGESHRLNLEQGVSRACQRVMEASEGGEEMQLELAAFPDRIEIVLENADNAGTITETDSFLLNQLLDRVVVEETREGKRRLTLVMFLTRVESQP